MGTLRIITDLRDSEINGEIAWLYDGVWAAKLDDPINGYVTEATASSHAEAAVWLCVDTVRRYPDSEFPRKYGKGLSNEGPTVVEPDRRYAVRLCDLVGARPFEDPVGAVITGPVPETPSRKTRHRSISRGNPGSRRACGTGYHRGITKAAETLGLSRW